MQVGSKKAAGGGAAPPPDEAVEDKSLAEAAAKLQQDITDVFEQEDDGTAPVSLVNAFPDTYNADYYDRGSSQSSAEESWTPALLVRDAIKDGVEEAFGPQVERTKALAPEEATEAAEEVVEEDAAGAKAEEDPVGAAGTVLLRRFYLLELVVVCFPVVVARVRVDCFFDAISNAALSEWHKLSLPNVMVIGFCCVYVSSRGSSGWRFLVRAGRSCPWHRGQERRNRSRLHAWRQSAGPR